jgi:diguanylate cyclase (GGDEF)-like protein/putative nucleotidyltransferase with HDIG domain
MDADRSDRNAIGSRLAALAALDPEERGLAGRVVGALWAVGGLTLGAFVFLPGIDHRHSALIVALAAAAGAWGLVQAFVVPWRRVPQWLLHLSVLAGFVVIGVIVASSGGSRSPGWIYLFFIAIFAPYFFTAATAGLYIAGCVLIQAIPMLYDPHWTRGEYIGALVISAPAYVAFWATIVSGKALARRLRAQAELLAGEQSALRRIATLALEGERPEAIYAEVSREAALMIGAGAAGILRFQGQNEAVVTGSWADHPGGRYEPGTVVQVVPGSDVARARDLQVPARIDHHPAGSPVDRLGYSASIVVPVVIGAHTWGAIAVAADADARLSARDDLRLMDFSELLARAIVSLDERATLTTQASTDPLTGLANRRTLEERLVAEVSRAGRHARTLAAAVIDIDRFKDVNDWGGHAMGDQLLIDVAECLAGHARTEDTLARLGGDEYAWIMPDTTRDQAWQAVERVRRDIAVKLRKIRITVSAGICDTSTSTHPAELMSFADSALYWSKAHGRNRSWMYDSDLITELTDPARAAAIDRGPAVLALRALARAIDAKDQDTREHSERVAELAAKLARYAGWLPQRSMLLREAALMHDVGKIGVPDELLCSDAKLTESERVLVQEHAELTARIVEGILEPEQVDWIRAHHERPDGHGYPLGLQEPDIPEGAALLTLADAWDAMTRGRRYSEPKAIEASLHECREQIGHQFTKPAVGALLKLHADGELDAGPPEAAPHLVSGVT